MRLEKEGGLVIWESSGPLGIRRVGRSLKFCYLFCNQGRISLLSVMKMLVPISDFYWRHNQNIYHEMNWEKEDGKTWEYDKELWLQGDQADDGISEMMLKSEHKQNREVNDGYAMCTHCLHSICTIGSPFFEVLYLKIERRNSVESRDFISSP